MPRLKENGQLATAGLLAMAGVPVVAWGSWSEHNKRALKPILSADRDMLGRWKPEGSDIYMRAHGG